MKLKTLNKITKNGRELRSREELQIEAIKWINALEKARGRYPNGLKFGDFEAIEGDDWEKEEDTITPIVKWIMYFFKVTKEMLK